MCGMFPADIFSTKSFPCNKGNQHDLFLIYRVAPEIIQSGSINLHCIDVQDEIHCLDMYINSQLSEFNTIIQVANFCIELCVPYEHPFQDALFFDPIFNPKHFRTSVCHYLLVQYLLKCKAPSKDTYLKQLQDVGNLRHTFDEQSSKILKERTLRNFPYPLWNRYFFQYIKKPSKKDSIYDFIVKAALMTTPMKWNPYVINFLPDVLNSDTEFENFYNEVMLSGNKDKPEFLLNENSKNKFRTNLISLSNSNVTPAKLSNFLSHFYLDKIHFCEQDINFKNIISYIVESISNIELINLLYEIQYNTLRYQENSLLPSVFYLFSLYPLVSYRLELLRHISQAPLDNDYKKIDPNPRVSFNNSNIIRFGEVFSLNELRSVLLYQILFYFPLISRLFQIFVTIKQQRSEQLEGLENPKDDFILSKDICKIFNMNLITGKDESHLLDDMIKKRKDEKLYTTIQSCVYRTYYDLVSRSTRYDFVWKSLGYRGSIDLIRKMLDDMGLNDNLFSLDNEIDSNIETYLNPEKFWETT